MRRSLLLLTIAAVSAAIILLILLPPARVATAAPPATVVRGAYHVHTNRSDGSGSPDQVAAAAAAAGLQYLILTDHGDGTRPPDAPAYRSGVLVIDAVELNTTGGHYAAIGLPAAPYPLAGTPAAVIEDVRRLGGFGIAAHPGSPRASLQWTDWAAPIDGLEWINGDSEWRDEPRLPIARALLAYLLRAPEAMAQLLDRPDAILARWDAMHAERRVFTIAGTDAHAWLGYGQGDDPEGALHLPLPGYEATFRTLSNHVELDTPFSGDAAADGAALIASIREGRVYSVIDALAGPGSLSFTASSGDRQASTGQQLPIAGDVIVRASAGAPPGTTIVLLKNGVRVHEAIDAPIEMNGGRDAAVYRVEAYVRNSPGGPPAPWIVSNPIYVGGPTPVVLPLVDLTPASRIPARVAEAATEAGRGDTSSTAPSARIDPRSRRFAGEPPLQWTFALSPGTPSGQFAAVRIPVTGGLEAFDRVRLRVQAGSPLRAWVQLRARDGGERWGTTFYADATERLIDLPLRLFLPIGETSQAAPSLDRIDSLLFVADTVNFLPGASGSMLLSEIAFVR